MGRSVDGRAAAVDPDVPGLERDELTLLAGQRVEQADGHPTAPTVATARAAIPRPAPSAPARLPVDALTLTLRSGSARAARRSPPGSRRAGRPGAVGQPRSSGRSGPGAARRPPGGRRPSRTSSPLAIPRGVVGSGREEPAEIAQAGRAEQRVGDGVERNVAVRVAVEPRARRRSRSRPGRAARPVRTGGCRPHSRSGSAARPSSTSSARPRSSGVVTLRFVGSPGMAWTGILQASRRAASSVQVSVPSAGNVSKALASSSRRTPCGVWAARELRPIDGRADLPAVDPLDRLDDRARPGSRHRARPRPA